MRWPWKKKEESPLPEDNGPKILDVWASFDSDKCDQCHSPARVRVFIPHVGQILDFCGHHFRENEKKFNELGYMWIDGRNEREKFTRTLQDISGKL